ncbi:MAG: diaminopimelate decarboxylase [Muribaculaceae bacterium]
MERTRLFNQLETPCFILNGDEFTNCISEFQLALNKNFSNATIGYSVKTNSLPYCLSLAKKNGAFAEVVSSDEYELAHKCGFIDQHIIYNGPMKSKETFLNAVSNNAMVNVESKRELEWLKLLSSDQSYSIGLRLNLNISKISEEDAYGDNDNSRFGFSTETSEFEDAVEYISSLQNVRIAGIHIHRTSHSRSIRFYRNSISFACDIIKRYRLCIDYLDIGGGFFGPFPNKPSFQEYSDAFYDVLSSFGLEKLHIIVEPGNAIAASSFKFLCEVIDVKHTEKERWFITTNGSRNDIDPFFKKSSYLQEEHYNCDTSRVAEQIVSGCTCLEYDRLYSLYNKPLLCIGDRILFNNVGAYTLCLTPMFIRYAPTVYLQNNHQFTIIRERLTANDYINKSLI